MTNKHYAAIDIGSNAIRLLIKELRPAEEDYPERLDKALLLRVPLRLGFDVFTTGTIAEEKVTQMRRLMKSYKQLMKIYDVVAYRAVATSAMRDATNGDEVIRKIKKDTGINIDIISGDEEAALLFNNHFSCTDDNTGNAIYVDIGGGSTEITLLVNGQRQFAYSYNIGTVRMLHHAVDNSVWQLMEDDLTQLTKSLTEVNIIASGGTINRLYRLAAKRSKKSQHVTISAIKDVYLELKPLTIVQRQERYGLKADRADVIIPAAEIFLNIAKYVKAQYVTVPVRGLADGIIHSLHAAPDCLLTQPTDD